MPYRLYWSAFSARPTSVVFLNNQPSPTMTAATAKNFMGGA